jgi:selenocysteine-specific translation elongation factor
LAIEFVLERGPHILRKLALKKKKLDPNIHSTSVSYFTEELEKEIIIVYKDTGHVQEGGQFTTNFENHPSEALSYWQKKRLYHGTNSMQNLAELLGVILNLSVTNALVESSFSIEKNVIRDNRSVLKISSINDEMRIKFHQILQKAQLRHFSSDPIRTELGPILIGQFQSTNDNSVESNNK